MFVNEKMASLGSKSSVIREIFEYGRNRKREIGEENVFDFSLGNPSVPSPDVVRSTLAELIEKTDPAKLHAYTSAAGDPGVRRAIAEYITKTHGTMVGENDIYLTVGAAASLTVSLTALINPGDEVIVLAPFFPEYRVFVERAGGVLKVVQSDPVTFQPDIDLLRSAINQKTKAIIINSPNNPTGVVLTEESVTAVSELLRKSGQRFGTRIFIIADEPYRELVFGDVKVPYIPNCYDDTIVCYSFSKSLSLPGERIGYVMVSPKMQAQRDVWFAVCGAGRALGFVCAPALFQYMIPACLGKTSDISVYDRNRKLLYDSLSSYGFTAVKPDGAFYLFVKAPEPNAKAFCERAKRYELLLVPSDDFGTSGFVRVAYCVATEQIERALPAFSELAKEYGLERK